jgi:hypothetical protein
MRNIGTTGLPAAEREDMAVLAAIELSLKRWRVAAVSPASDKVTRVDIAGGSADILSQQLERWRSQATAHLGRRVLAGTLSGSAWHHGDRDRPGQPSGQPPGPPGEDRPP